MKRMVLLSSRVAAAATALSVRGKLPNLDIK